jgi:hypothetical protein
MEWLDSLLLLVIAGLIGWLIRLAYQILACLERNAEFQTAPAWRASDPSCHGQGMMTKYSTWKYHDGRWQLIEKHFEEKLFEPGEAPLRPGAYDGEIVRRPAVRKKEKPETP